MPETTNEVSMIGTASTSSGSTVAVSAAAAGNAAAPQVTAFLNRYFTAINAHDYQAYDSPLDQQLQLGVYVRVARRQGASEDEIREVLRQVAVYAGFPSAWNALTTMKQALEGLGEPPNGTNSDR